MILLQKKPDNQVLATLLLAGVGIHCPGFKRGLGVVPYDGVMRRFAGKINNMFSGELFFDADAM